MCADLSFDGLEICFDHNDGEKRIILLRKAIDCKVKLLTMRITEDDSYSWIPTMQQILRTYQENENKFKLILFAEQKKYSGLLGLSVSLLREYGNDRFSCFLIMDETAPPFSLSHPFYAFQLAKNMAINVHKNGSWGFYANVHLKNIETTKVHHAHVKTMTKGNLRTIRWVQGPIKPLENKPIKEKQLVYVYNSSLNFRDIMFATGKLSNKSYDENGLDDEIVQGFEFSGKLVDGHRVMGLGFEKCMASLIETNPNFMWSVPDNWSLEDAATVPVAYLTVILALNKCGNLKPGESILIHAGAGGVGQAAINICTHYNCVIFTTVGSKEKRDFIRRTYPNIPESHIGNSRDTSFKEMIMSQTKGKGVNLVLNSLAEEKLTASAECLGYKGRFLEIGLFDIYMNNPLGLRSFENEMSFHAVELLQIMKTDVQGICDSFRNALKDGIVKPIQKTSFPVDKVEEAFRYMASGKHIGKVIINIRDEEDKLSKIPEPILLDAKPRYWCSEEKSYVICGGLGGMGLELIDWLVLRGARKIVISSKRGITTGYQAWKIRTWNSYGANVVVLTDDITKEEGVQMLLQTAKSMGPVSAIFNVALVLLNKLFEEQTVESFATCCGPKGVATRHLDRLSRIMCPKLDHFVVFSSIITSIGNVGQTNYAMANSVMERICEERHSSNLPAMAIQWGPVDDVGALTVEDEKHSSMISDMGLSLQSIKSCLETMDRFMTNPKPLVSSFVAREKKISVPVKRSFSDAITEILGWKNYKSLNPSVKLTEYGLDSLSIVEFRNALGNDFNVFLDINEIKNATFATLFELEAKIEASIKFTNEKTDGYRKSNFGEIEE